MCLFCMLMRLSSCEYTHAVKMNDVYLAGTNVVNSCGATLILHFLRTAYLTHDYNEGN